MKKRQYMQNIILLSLCIVIDLFGNVMAAKAQSTDYTTLVSQIDHFARAEVTAQFDYWIDLLWDELKDPPPKEQAEMGTPFIYYDASRTSAQNASCYYPVIVRNEIIGVINAVFYDGSWTLSITDTDNDFRRLNEINYPKTEVLFYIEGDQVIAETEEASVPFTALLDDGKTTRAQKKFSKLSFREKCQEIVRNTKNLGKEKQAGGNEKNIAWVEKSSYMLSLSFAVVIIIFILLLRKRRTAKPAN